MCINNVGLMTENSDMYLLILGTYFRCEDLVIMASKERIQIE